MIKYIKNHIAKSESQEIELREKLIRRTMILATFLVFIGFIEIFFATSTYYTAIPIGVLLVTLILFLFLINKY